MDFEWDSAKDASNRRKHGIGFREAAEIFRRPVLISEDARRDYGERRLIALGEYRRSDPAGFHRARQHHPHHYGMEGQSI